MVRSGLVDKIQGTSTSSERTAAAVVRQLENIVEEAELLSDSGHDETACWFYWVPFPGVRYYSYEEWPTPVDGASRPRRAIRARSG